jgi:hypothetical protein
MPRSPICEFLADKPRAPGYDARPSFQVAALAPELP